ncbi:Uncharacterised protein [Serratia plymuthica]|nr:Uncharacterised protein [Serratia plymuthica]
MFDPSLLPEGQKLLLEPWEYEEGGYFYPAQSMDDGTYGRIWFYRPFTEDGDGVAVEPWHLSYRPLAQEAEHLLTPALLLAAWQNKDVAGAEWLERQSARDIFTFYTQ